MFSPRLIQLVESNWQRIAADAVQATRNDPRAPSYRKLPDRELYDRAYEVLRNLGWWLIEADRDELHRLYVALGQLRHSEGIPEMEVVRKLQILKRTVRQFLEDQRICHNAIELHSEYELLKAVDVFFDEAVYAVVKGYCLQREWAAERREMALPAAV